MGEPENGEERKIRITFIVRTLDESESKCETGGTGQAINELIMSGHQEDVERISRTYTGSVLPNSSTVPSSISSFKKDTRLYQSSKSARADKSVDYAAVGVHEHDYIPRNMRGMTERNEGLEKKTEDHTMESLQRMQQEIRNISAWREESAATSGKLSSIDSKVDEIFTHVQQLSMTQDSLETQYSHDPPGEDGDNEESELGSGKFSTVFRMRFKLDGQLYAVKEMPVKTARNANIDLRAVMLEVHAMSVLTHHNVIRYFNCFYSRNHKVFNVVMEYADGGTLAGQVECTPGPTIGTLTRWLGESLSALDYIHSQSMLHRDIKPENILLKKRAVLGGRRDTGSEEVYEIKLAGLGPVAAANSSVGHQTTICTAEYSSYEKLNGERYDSKDDIWGLGCVFAELLTRRRLHGCGKGNWGVRMSSRRAEMQLKKQEVLQTCVDANAKVGQLVVQMLREVPAERPNAKSLLESLVLVSLRRELLRLNCVYSIHEQLYQYFTRETQRRHE